MFPPPLEPFALLAALSIPVAILYSWRRKAPLSLTFAVVMLVTFVLGYVDSLVSKSGGRDFVSDLAVYWLRGVHSSPASYVTTMFLHASLTHLLLNLLFLLLLGPMIEDRIGSLRWGVIFLVGGLFATGGFELVRFATTDYIVVGASGALSAIFGAFGRLYPRERIGMFIPLPIPPMPAIYYVIGFAVIQFVFAFAAGGAAAGIAWEAHIAGLAFGFALAPLVMRVPDRRKAPAVRNFQPLLNLVRGHDLEEIYGHLSKEPLRAAQEAWLERFARKASCPQCGKPLAWSRGALRSDCGWKLRLS